MNSDLKIVFAGPPSSGKTELANITSAASKGFTGDCQPTFCVRILEFAATVDVYGLQSNISAQIWDTSGDEKYRAAWPAIAYHADGVCLVYNAFEKEQGRQMEAYAKAFCKDVNKSQVLVVAHKKGDSDAKACRPKLPKSLDNVQIIVTNAKDSADEFVDEFNKFLTRVQQHKLRKIEEKEKQLVGEEVETEEASEGTEE